MTGSDVQQVEALAGEMRHMLPKVWWVAAGFGTCRPASEARKERTAKRRAQKRENGVELAATAWSGEWLKLRSVPVPVKLHFLLAAACAACWTAPGQTNPAGELDWSDLPDAVQGWAQENLDPEIVAVFGEVERQKVEEFLRQFEKQLAGEYVLDLAPLKDAAKIVLPLLDAREQTQPYAVWLRSRLDYFEAAQELRAAMPPPMLQPGQPPPPPPKPAPDAQRKVWKKKLSQRPLPRGAEILAPQLKEIFAAQRVPPELIWLAEVESSFDRRARSPVGAAGLFQLMPATAKRFGLRRWPLDQRYQVEPSARAAAQYLKALHGLFRDWPLALAAYNTGEGVVAGLLGKHKAWSFDGIATHLPAETQMYIPKMEATLLRREGASLSKLPAPGK